MQRSLFRTYLALLLMAVFGASLAALAGRHTVAVAIILGLALAKGRLVILDFMDMRRRPGLLPAACLLWCGALLTLALARFFIAS